MFTTQPVLPRSYSFALPAILLFCLLVPPFLQVSDAFAKMLYVQPSSEVVVRRGQGTDFKIIAMVKSGTNVVLLEEGTDYSRVRLPNNKEGWMLTRFLSEQPPLQQVVDSLRSEAQELTRSRNEAVQKFEEIASVLSTTEKELQAIIAERDQALTDFQELQESTADTMKIKQLQQKTAQENKTILQKLSEVESRNRNLEKDSTVKWFLAGGGVLLLGMLIGASSNKSRRKKSSLY